jgi:hypothetical protein
MASSSKSFDYEDFFLLSFAGILSSLARGAASISTLGLVREVVIVSGNDVSRRFSGMTVLNWKPADESLEQARNK